MVHSRSCGRLGRCPPPGVRFTPARRWGPAAPEFTYCTHGAGNGDVAGLAARPGWGPQPGLEPGGAPILTPASRFHRRSLVMRLSSSYRVLLGAFAVAAPLAAQTEEALSAGDTRTLDLGPGESVEYVVSLNADQFVYGEVVQTDGDLRVVVFDGEGTELDAFDGLDRGAEPFSFTTEDAGRYRLRIESQEEEGEASGRVELLAVEAVASGSRSPPRSAHATPRRVRPSRCGRGGGRGRLTPPDSRLRHGEPGPWYRLRSRDDLEHRVRHEAVHGHGPPAARTGGEALSRRRHPYPHPRVARHGRSDHPQKSSQPHGRLPGDLQPPSTHRLPGGGHLRSLQGHSGRPATDQATGRPEHRVELQQHGIHPPLARR